MTDRRRVVWFSCGISSAVAARHVVQKISGGHDVRVVYCDVSSSEHPDNMRFLRDIEVWIGQRIEIIASRRYVDVDDVISRTRYMSGPSGARCTVELKKVPRFEYQRCDDIHVFGFTADEIPRVTRFVKQNPELATEWPLVDGGVTKLACRDILARAQIRLPAMYELGYGHNNCLGCVKATGAAYWRKIRHDFPAVYRRRCEQSRGLGVRLVQWRGERIYLDTLPPDGDDMTDGGEDMTCGPECVAAVGDER